MPLLAACGGGAGGAKNEGTTTGQKLKDILPAYVPSTAVTPLTGTSAGIPPAPLELAAGVDRVLTLGPR